MQFRDWNVFQILGHIFVERSSTRRTLMSPPQIWKRFSAPRACQHIFLISRAQPHNCNCTILQLQFTSVILKVLIYKYNLRASLNHRANICSCYIHKVDVMITIFCDVCKLSAKKWLFLKKKPVLWSNILQTLTVFLAKNANFFRQNLQTLVSVYMNNYFPGVRANLCRMIKLEKLLIVMVRPN
jgi:hypothetical protein